MKIGTTIGFSQADHDWREAYAAYDALADADADGTPAMVEADAKERRLYDAVLARPAETAMEVHRKLAIIDTACERGSRNPERSETDPLKMDMLRLSRPNASPAIADAFDYWAAARTASCFFNSADEESGGEEEADRLFRAECDAFISLLNVPCTTPGDFIVKAFADIIDDIGGVPESDDRPLPYWPFEPHREYAGSIQAENDRAAFSARIRDIEECDLGRCMIALGRVDFDAAAWVRQCERVGKDVKVILNDDGRGLWFGLDGHGRIADHLQCLMAGGLKDISDQRCTAIADEIEANHPHLICDHRGREAAPVTEAARERILDSVENAPSVTLGANGEPAYSRHIGDGMINKAMLKEALGVGERASVAAAK